MVQIIDDSNIAAGGMGGVGGPGVGGGGANSAGGLGPGGAGAGGARLEGSGDGGPESPGRESSAGTARNGEPEARATAAVIDAGKSGEKGPRRSAQDRAEKGPWPENEA